MEFDSSETEPTPYSRTVKFESQVGNLKASWPAGLPADLASIAHSISASVVTRRGGCKMTHVELIGTLAPLKVICTPNQKNLLAMRTWPHTYG